MKKIKRNRKKIMPVLFAALLCFAVLPSFGFFFGGGGRVAKADDSYIHSGEGWGIKADGTLVINLEGEIPRNNNILPD